MVKFSVAFAGFVLVLAGCAQTPVAVYETIKERKNVVTLEEASKDQVGAFKVSLQSTQSFEISSTSKVLDDGQFQASFQMFEFVVDSERPVNISVQSMCDCFGLSKYVMVPRIHVAIEGGQKSKVFPRSRTAKPSGWDPASIVSTWSTEPLKPGRHFLLIYADNRSLAASVADFADSSVMPAGKFFIPTTSSYSLEAHPFGKFKLRIE